MRARTLIPSRSIQERKATADDDGAQAAQLPEVSATMREFLDTVDSLKSKRSRADQFDEADADEAIVRLINEMRDAVQLDLESNQRREPAFAKLKLLPKVIGLLEKSYLHDQILEHEMLDAVRRWLEPLPDGSLPAINIRRALLQALQKMPISMDNLRECKLGRVIMFEYQCEKELPELRKIAGDLISQWTRPLLNRAMERARRVEPRRIPHSMSMSSSSSSRAPTAADADGEEDMRAGEINQDSRYARIPQSIRATYSVQPQSMVDVPEEKSVSKFKKMSQQLGRTKSKGESRLNRVSVEGRGLQ